LVIAGSATASVVIVPHVLAALILSAVVPDENLDPGLDVKTLFGPAIGAGKAFEAVRIGHDEFSFLVMKTPAPDHPARAVVHVLSIPPATGT
jgi:hypothetical protein